MFLQTSLSCVTPSGSVIREGRSVPPPIREHGVLNATVIRQTSATSQHVRHTSHTTAESAVSLTTPSMHQAPSNFLVQFSASDQLTSTLLFSTINFTCTAVAVINSCEKDFENNQYFRDGLSGAA
jgi:hypothetical protein